jgi:outer membrane protein TolC
MEFVAPSALAQRAAAIPKRQRGNALLPLQFAALAVLLALSAKFASAQGPWRIIYPEQRQIEVREPHQFRYVPLPPTSPPPTVSQADPDATRRLISLDEAIRIALENDRVVRVLAGTTAVASGQTIYDVAIVNTAIDEQQARFDPFLTVNNNWDHLDLPSAVFVDPNNPIDSIIAGRTTNQYRLNAALTKDNPLGGQWRLGVDATQQFLTPGIFPLNPQTTSSADVSYTQPLLSGFGRPANLAPIVLARIDTERSFFQLKDAVQEQVRGVIEAYWNLVSARTAVWAREQQVARAEFNFRRTDASFRVGLANGGDLAQTRSALANFRAQLISARGEAIQSEAALRNILGLPPWDQAELVPTTEPTLDRYRANWPELVELAAQQRPDLIELKLILEADEQQLVIANNNALPRLDATALYRWNGLSGEMPSGNAISTAPGQFNDWTMGVNFSVPLGLRQGRAQLRQRELILARDQANLEQGLHAASHTLATTVRNLDRAFEQYIAFQDARAAADDNTGVQDARYRNRLQDYLAVRIALEDWGNAVANEAAALTGYNTLLAELERQSGTILETHGVRFYEERYGSIGPLGRLHQPACYPRQTAPTPNFDRYRPGNRAAENFFDLTPPVQPEPRGSGPSRPREL